MTRILVAIALALSAAASAEAACTTPSLTQTNVSTGLEGYRFALGDVDRDGDVDIASHGTLANQVRIHPGNGDGTFATHVPYTVSGPRTMLLHDVNRDQWPDLIVNHEDTKLGVLLNAGNGTFGAISSVNHALNTVSTIDAADLDGDGDRDLLIVDLNGVNLLWNSGSGSFPTKTTIVVSGVTESALAADFNDDGRVDLAIASSSYNQQPGRLFIYLNSPNLFPASASSTYTFTNTNATIALAPADFNNDNRVDLAVSFFDGFAAYLGHSSGNGTFTAGMTMTVTSSGFVDFFDVTTGDFNEDGKDDMAFASLNGWEQYVILGLGNGNFQTPPYTMSGTYSHANRIEAADMDNDGRMDIVRYEYDTDQVQIFRNTCAVRYATASVSSSQNPAAYGTAVTFTATVAGRAKAPTPTGSISLYVDDVLKETKSLSAGSVSFAPISGLTIGSHSVRVQYLGSTDFAAASSPAISQEITRPPFGTPFAFQAFRYGATTTAVHMTWIGVQDASGYEMFRMNNGGTWTSIGTTTGENFADLMVPDANPQVYAVRALRTGGDPSAMTAPDIATTYIYATTALPGTLVRAADVTELRTLINGLRTRVGFAAATFTDASLSGQYIKAVHVTELRTALHQALSHLGLATPSYTQAALTARVATLKAADLQELRNAIY